MRNKIYGILALICAPFALVAGLNMAFSDEVDCGGETMAANDTCITTSDGGTTERDVSEQRTDNKAGGWALAGGSLVMAAFGIYTVRKMVRQSRNGSASPQMMVPQPGQYPPPGAYPQQPVPYPQQQQPVQYQQPVPYAPQQNQTPWPPQQPGYPPNGRPGPR